MKKIALIGNYGIIGQPAYDGQTIKTRIVAQELKHQYGETELIFINTYGGFVNLFKSPFQCLKAIFSASNILIQPDVNGIRVYAPILFVLSFLFRHKKLHYSVIGGWLPTFVKKRPILKYVLKHFQCIYVETNTMLCALQEQGFKNIYLMPNFKNLNIVTKEQLKNATTHPLKLCIFSRINKEKGVADAVDIVNRINLKCGRPIYSLDIYGKIDPLQQNWFDQLQSSFSEHISYKGVVDYNKSVDVLKDYFALLFPTHYYTEGIPGTIIDAYAAGLPVISSKWQSFSDIIDDKSTGLGYEFDNINQLEEILITIANNPDIINNLKHNCILKAEEYLPTKAILPLINNVD